MNNFIFPDFFLLSCAVVDGADGEVTVAGQSLRTAACSYCIPRTALLL